MYRAEIDFDDCKYILDNLRKEDIQEVESTRGQNWKEEILNDLKQTDHPFLLAKTKKDDIPVLMCGAWNIDASNPSIGIVWLLTTDEIEKHQISFLREMKKELQEYDEHFGLIYNQVYKSNKLVKRWLRWAGFRFPQNEKKKTPLDKMFLQANLNEEFEIFYRERKIKGLGE